MRTREEQFVSALTAIFAIGYYEVSETGVEQTCWVALAVLDSLAVAMEMQMKVDRRVDQLFAGAR